MNRPRPTQRPVLTALVGLVGLWLLSASAYSALWWLDFRKLADAPGPLALFGSPEAADTVAGLGEVTVAVLGIAITVVAIIVELAANRYTPRITELFIRDPINATVLAFFTVVSTLVIATAMSLGGPIYPSIMVTMVVMLMMVCLVAVLPYFLYVFDFLTPRSIIERIQANAIDGLSDVARRGEGAVSASRRDLATSVEQLGEIALNSVVKKDKAIAIMALTALAEIAEAAMLQQDRLPDRWFDTEPLANTDQDFVAFHPDIARRLTQRRIWVEMKVLRQFQSVFGESLGTMPDVAHIVAIHTRSLAVLAAEARHDHAARLCLRLLHTYFRACINAQDVRSAYNTFNEYRAVGEGLLGCGAHDLVVEIAERSRFYGQLAFQRKLPFILETAAYDLCTLIEVAWEREAPCHDAMLATFLELDREPDEARGHQEASLRGVRKAQVKLATWYLAHGAESLARRIFEDMRHEPPERLASIRAELESIEEPEFWEVSDRGINFDWLPDNRRKQLPVFFGFWGGG